MRFWPPFWGAGIRVKSFHPDLSYVEVEMKLRFWNQNYVGTQFGGSLYSMTDPFYMLMLIKNLGKEYVVWDKSAKIRYLKPACTHVFAEFKLDKPTLQLIKQEADNQSKSEPKFTIQIKDLDNEVIAEIEKTLHIRRKQADPTLGRSQ